MVSDLKTRPSKKNDTQYADRLKGALRTGSDGDIILARQNASDQIDKQVEPCQTLPQLLALVKEDILDLKDDEGNLSIQMICQAGYTIQTARMFQQSI